MACVSPSVSEMSTEEQAIQPGSHDAISHNESTDYTHRRELPLESNYHGTLTRVEQPGQQSMVSGIMLPGSANPVLAPDLLYDTPNPYSAEQEDFWKMYL